MTSPNRPRQSRSMTRRLKSPHHRVNTKVPISGKQLVSFTKLRRRWEAKQMKKAGPVVPYGARGPWSPQSNFLARNSLIALPPPRARTPPPPLSPRGLKPTPPARPPPRRRQEPEPPQNVAPVPSQEVDLSKLTEAEQIEYAIAMSTGAQWTPTRAPSKSKSRFTVAGTGLMVNEDEQLARALQESMLITQPPRRQAPKPPAQDVNALLQRQKRKGTSWKSNPPMPGLKLLPELEDEDYDSEVAIAMSLEQPIPPRLYVSLVDSPDVIAKYQSLRKINQTRNPKNVESMYERRPLESPPLEGATYEATKPTPAPVRATAGRGRFFSSILNSASPGSRLRQDSALPTASLPRPVREPPNPQAPAPLHNLRATCYMNSYLQVFMSLQEYNDRFQEILNTATARYIEFGMGPLQYLEYITPYSDFYWTYQSHRGSRNGQCLKADLQKMFICIGALSEDFRDSTSEQDTMQLIMTAIDRCIKDFQELGLEMNAADEFLRIGNAYLDTCTQCNNLQIAGELDSGIRLDIPDPFNDKIPSTVQDCIYHTYDLIEEITRECNKCKLRGSSAPYRGANRRIQVASIGTFVFFSLKRFPALSKKCNKMIRVNGVIDLPMVNPETGAPVEPAKLNLRAVICHVGATIYSGHYFAYVYNPPDQRWYQCNDSMITPVQMTDQSVLTSINNNAFVMVYEKRTSS